MSKYYCKHCNYDAKIKGNYDRHLKTKKHKLLAEISPKLAEISPKLAEDTTRYECKYCDKNFKHHSSLCKHIKYTCKKNKDEDLKELARLLNEKDQKMEKIQTTMQKQIEKLTQKLQIQNVVHGDFNQTTNHQNNNIYNIRWC